MPDDRAVASLRATFRGALVGPEDPAYETARRVYNGMIDRAPRLIARCADAEDVIAAVRWGRDQGLPIAVRGGGHNVAGLGVCDGGVVIDLSPIRYVRVDPAAATVRVGGGTTWGDVDHVTHAFGMATPNGIISTTGVGGLTLGGGIGYLARQCGLTIDNLLGADMVLADGRFVTVGPEAHPDLFWAIRGGGGNFGIVTSFLFRLHPISTVHAGPSLWALDDAADVLHWYRAFMPAAPQDLNGFFMFLTVPPAPMFPEHLHRKKMCGIMWCDTGAADGVERRFKPVRQLKAPAFESVGPMPLPTLQSLFDPLYPPGLQHYWRADFVTELDDEAITEHETYGAALPTPLSTMHLYPVDGAVHGVRPADTAWSYRDTTWAMVIVGVDPEAKHADRITRWTRDYWNAVHTYSAGGAYVNFMMDEGEARVKATYRGNYSRLARIKNTYDPTNIFRINQNIPPASAA